MRAARTRVPTSDSAVVPGLRMARPPPCMVCTLHPAPTGATVRRPVPTGPPHFSRAGSSSAQSPARGWTARRGSASYAWASASRPSASPSLYSSSRRWLSTSRPPRGSSRSSSPSSRCAVAARRSVRSSHLSRCGRTGYPRCTSRLPRAASSPTISPHSTRRSYTGPCAHQEPTHHHGCDIEVTHRPMCTL